MYKCLVPVVLGRLGPIQIAYSDSSQVSQRLPETRDALIMVFWAVLICCVVIGSLLPAASPVNGGGSAAYTPTKNAALLSLPGAVISTGDRVPGSAAP